MKLKSINPADQTVVGEVEVATSYDIEKAVEKAKMAFKFWKEIPVEERAFYVEKFAKETLKHREKLARLSTLEMGKPYSQSLEDIAWDQDYLSFYVKEGPKILEGEIIEKTSKFLRKVIYEPIGVVAVITPWNFPFGMPIWGIMPNLVAGNTVVFKPSEYTPLCGQEIVEILSKVGLPHGVVNIIHGDGEVGKALVDTNVNLVWFTGSTKVGQEIYEKCGKKFIRCLLELGGSSPAIIMNDVNISQIIEIIYWGRFSNCGQVCSAIKRLFVHQKIYEEFVKKLVERVKKTKVGNPFDKVDLGPLVSKKQLALLETQVEDAVKKGVRIEIGGEPPKDLALQNGNYFLPTILTNVNFEMRVLTEEVFGPVLPVMPFEKADEVVEMANRTEYGLTAQIYTNSLELARKMAAEIEAGTVSTNSDEYFSPRCPFGGYKKSGIGREGGKYGFHELTQIKYIFEKP